MSGPTIAMRRQGFTDPCWTRDRWLASAAERRALGHARTRRLVVTGAGHFHDHGHGHVFATPRGAPFTAIFICTEGAGWITMGGTRRRVSPGSAMLIPEGVPHAYGPAELPWSIWWCAVVGSDTPDLLRTAGVSESDPTIRVRDAPRLARIIDEIAAVYERPRSPTPIVDAAGIARTLMTGIGADLSRSGADPVLRVRHYLAEHFPEWVPVSELASRVGLSRTRLNQLFQAETGGGVLAYQIGLRMTRARLLLTETDDDVTVVARSCGYGDPDYFSRQFSRIHGLSPTRYRAER